MCFSSFLIVKWNILLCSSIFHSSTQDKIPWFRLPTLSWTITSWQLLLPLQHMALSSSSPFSRRPSSFQSFYSYSTILFSCPEQINRWPCPLVGPLVCPAPLTIRVFTSLQPTHLWPLGHLIRETRRHDDDLTKKDLPTYIPTYLPTYLPVNLH